MMKKVISYLIIISLIFIDIAQCMERDDEFGDMLDGWVVVRRGNCDEKSDDKALVRRAPPNAKFRVRNCSPYTIVDGIFDHYMNIQRVTTLRYLDIQDVDVQHISEHFRCKILFGGPIRRLVRIAGGLANSGYSSPASTDNYVSRSIVAIDKSTNSYEIISSVVDSMQEPLYESAYVDEYPASPCDVISQAADMRREAATILVHEVMSDLIRADRRNKPFASISNLGHSLKWTCEENPDASILLLVGVCMVILYIQANFVW